MTDLGITCVCALVLVKIYPSPSSAAATSQGRKRKWLLWEGFNQVLLVNQRDEASVSILP